MGLLVGGVNLGLQRLGASRLLLLDLGLVFRQRVFLPSDVFFALGPWYSIFGGFGLLPKHMGLLLR